MKPQQLSRLLDVSPSTLRVWAREEYTEFLSPNAAGINGAHRSFSEHDARILAWVAMMRTENVSRSDILITLRSAQADNWRKLPPLPAGLAGDEPIAVVPREAVEERFHALQDQFSQRVEALEQERDELKERLAKSEAANEALQQKLLAITERLLTLVERDPRRRK